MLVCLNVRGVERHLEIGLNTKSLTFLELYYRATISVGLLFLLLRTHLWHDRVLDDLQLEDVFVLLVR